MLKFKAISIDDLEPLVRLSYDGDEYGLQHCHVAPFTLEEGVECTMNLIRQEAKEVSFRCFAVFYDKKPIGYVVYAYKILYSFAIAVKYRTKEVLTKWFDKIVEVLGDGFVCFLYRNNERAIGFLERMGMKAVNEQNSIVTLIKY